MSDRSLEDKFAYELKPQPAIRAVKWTGDNLDQVREVYPLLGEEYMRDKGCLVGDYVISPCKGRVYFIAADVFEQKYQPISVQGQELPELDVTEADEEWSIEQGPHSSASGYFMGTKLSCRTRQLSASLAEIGRLKGERDEAYKETELSGSRLGTRYAAYCETSPKPMMTFSGWLNKRISDAETAEGEREAYRILMNEAREALSSSRATSRADALKEASECAAAYYSDDGFHPMLKNSSVCISQAILARMEKAS